MRLIFLIIRENKKVIINLSLCILLSLLLIFLTFYISYYIAIIAVPTTILTIYFTSFLPKVLRSSYKEFLSSNKYYNNGQKRYETFYDEKHEQDLLIFYRRDGHSIVISESKHLPSGHLSKHREYFENGKIRMLNDNSKFTFFDNNSFIRCEIHIESETIDRDVYRKYHNKNCLYRSHWNSGKLILYKPFGIWREFNEFGILISDLNFNGYISLLNVNSTITRNHYGSLGEIISTEFVYPHQLNMERFDPDFSFERLIDKKASYRPNTGWKKYYEFDILPVLTINDIITISQEPTDPNI